MHSNFLDQLLRRVGHSSSRSSWTRPTLLFGGLMGTAGAVGLPFLVDYLKQHAVQSVNADSIPLPLDPFKKQSPLFRENPYHLATKAVQRYMATNGIVGLSVGVSTDGRVVWKRGFGLTNVETATPCSAETVMRIASISKAITSVLTGKLVEEGKLDLDKPIQVYLPDFPQKSFNGKPVTITARQLLSHTAGIRHYRKADDDSHAFPNVLSPDNTDSRYPEFYSNRMFSTVNEAISVFRDDELVAEPGTKHHYTTHGYTLLSAVLESAGGRNVSQMLTSLFKQLGMANTQVDAKERILAHRANHYYRNRDTGRLENVPEVDCSNKVAGGGLTSNVSDLLTFANAVLYSHQYDNDGSRSIAAVKPLLKKVTIDELWKPHVKITDSKSEKFIPARHYCLGWEKVDGLETGGVPTSTCPPMWTHSGGAVGACSILIVKPNDNHGDEGGMESQLPPRGICVAIVHNCQAYGVGELGKELVSIFENSYTTERQQKHYGVAL